MGLTDLARRLLTGSLSRDEATLAESRRLVEAGRALLAEEPDWVRGSEDQAELAAILDDLESAVTNVDGRLIMGLLGGTGVGKSTLISALAGEEISSASPIRPTTSRPVVYRHESFPPLARIDGLEVVHQAESLRCLAIIDFPDFDSLETAHHQMVLDHFKNLDLVAWVTDHNKYADRRFYEVMNKVRGVVGSGAQVALLNKSDQLLALDDDGEALDYVLNSFARQLEEFGRWAGSAPWAVSAAEALAAPGDRAAGGLAPLRDLLDELADDKLRRSVEMGNLEARNAALAEWLKRAARPEKWLGELTSLQSLQRDFRPRGAIDADLAALTLTRNAYVAPRLEHLKKTAGGLLALFTEGWDFVAGRFKPGPDLPPPAPEPAAPALVHYLLGRGEDLALITGKSSPLNKDDLTRESGALIQKALDEHFQSGPKVGSALMFLWPAALAVLLIWAETGGQYGGPASLTIAAVRSAAPWLIFGFLGDLILSRFVWFRARRRYETAFHRALDQAKAALTNVAEQRLGSIINEAAERRTRVLDLLADIGLKNDD